MHTHQFATIAALALTAALGAAPAQTNPHQTALPRTADGKPDLEGIWQASGAAVAGLRDPAAGISYQPWAAAKRAENFQNRQQADPLGKCYMPGVPRIMY